MQPQSLKLTIKLKSDRNIENSLTIADHPSNVEGEQSASNSSNLPGSLKTNSPDRVDINSARGLENHTSQDEENPSENSNYQLVLYDPSVNGAGETETETETVIDPIDYRPPSFPRQHPFSNHTPRVLPSVGAFTVQCANCFKWRLIPTKEKYEEIREHIIEQPFFCETGREWRPDLSCDDPPDITQDGSRLWAIDKPNIAQPPPGWQRLLRIRGEGSTKFADVYYVAPTGKRLRSMVEIQRYLDQHPEHIEGVRLSQFSFQIPRPLQDNYVRKRPARPAATYEASDHGLLESSPSEVRRITWIGPDANVDLPQNGQGLSTSYFESPNSERSAKKKKTPSKRRSNGDLGKNQNDVNVEESGGYDV
ncbi:Methyl-CpG binding transcription regulator [Handroanthus impetiginosus]|uniref:Methyl-CpG binding transcription regulator n=1 Tax=Handroanthus impetiginosus TaxID=429701 RepID=A0A2G9HDA3_9LAMI|nr:Methyl-CpG binding transcription regulator [Handroanthus impetiginosus]PIN15443.1 Methyl-CpG binding transcription regulator [Handroanthus impetiginosus]